LVIPSYYHSALLKSATVSAKIPLSLKRKLERYRVSVSRVVRTALEREIMRMEEDDLARRLDEIRVKLSGKLTSEDVAAAVRRGRVER
jgi:hypothetical protein